MKRVLVTGFVLLTLALASGCDPYSSLPRIRIEKLPLMVPEFPADAAPVYAWSGEHPQLFTYWGKQSVTISATAHFPPDWKHGGDGFWRVKAENGEGKPLPFIGVIRRYVNENGTTLGVLVPKIDLMVMPDGLYVVIDPGVTLEQGEIVRIEPIAAIAEIRGQRFTPFRFPLPLVPETPSDLTPAPPPPPEIPEGTPIPVGE